MSGLGPGYRTGRNENVPPEGGTVLCTGSNFRSCRFNDLKDGSFTPCNKTNHNDNGKDRSHYQVALYISIVKQCVDFFHNLNFRFQKWLKIRFSKGGSKAQDKSALKGVRD